MNINSYVKTLKGSVDKSEVLASLDAVNQDLSTKVIPICNTAAAAFKVVKLKSPEVIAFESRYKDAFRLSRGANMFSDLTERLQTTVKNLDFVRDSIQKTLPETVASSAIDHRSAVLMQLVDNASFMNRYIRRFAEFAAINETQARGIYEDYQKNHLSKGEIGWVDNKFPMFISTLKALSENPNDFKKKFDEIPNVKVDTDSHNDNSLFGRGRMDPYQLGFIPVALNPFFHIGKWIAEFQAWRYKEAQEDLSRIQKRILLLEEADAGKSNPKVEKELEILRDKSEELTYKINKAEEEL